MIETSPLYREEFGSGNKTIVSAGMVLYFLFSLLMLIAIWVFIGTVGTMFQKDLTPIAIALTVIVSAIDAWIVWRSTKQAETKQTVEYYDDRLVVTSKKGKREIPYKEIKRVWKGLILSTTGRIGSAWVPPMYYVEEYPGLLAPVGKSVWANQMKQAGADELLVWNPKIVFGFGLMANIKPLIFEREGHDRVYLLEAKDLQKVVGILKAKTLTAEFSPILDEKPVLR